MLPENEYVEICKKFIRSLGWKGKSFIISALIGKGCKELTYAIMEHLEQNLEQKHES